MSCGPAPSSTSSSWWRRPREPTPRWRPPPSTPAWPSWSRNRWHPRAPEARALVERAVAAGVMLTVFHNRRWDAEFLTLRRLVADGALGDVVRYESRFERWRPERSAGAWREELSADDGGGVLLDLGVHLVDQARVLLGPVTHVYGEVAARRGGSDDDVFAALQHATGARSHLWASAVAAAPGPRLRVLGSKAAYVAASLDGQEDALRAGRRPDQRGFGDEPPERWGRLVRGAQEQPVPSAPGAMGGVLRGGGGGVARGHRTPRRPRGRRGGARGPRRRSAQRHRRHGHGALGAGRASRRHRGPSERSRVAGLCLRGLTRRTRFHNIRFRISVMDHSPPTPTITPGAATPRTLR